MLRLMKAAQEGDIGALYASIRLMPNLLEGFDQNQFVDTPLHIAAAAGQTHFAIEFMSLKPSFGRKLNPDGFSPLDLALQNKRTETVRRLVKIDHRLIRVQGKERLTPLHHVAGNGEVNLLAEFLVACPESIHDVNICGETAVHIAVRKGEIRALEVLLGWLKRTRKEEVLDWKDEKGDTVLHVAASTNQHQALEMLINKVNKNAQNFSGLTALDIISERPGHLLSKKKARTILQRAKCLPGSSLKKVATLSEFLRSPEGIDGLIVRLGLYLQMGLSSDKQNALLVVAVLIVTATYQGALSPPGGLSQGDNNNIPPINRATTCLNNATSITNSSCTNSISSNSVRAGKVVMSVSDFNRFLLFNSTALAASAGVIILILQISPYKYLLLFSLASLLLSYVHSMNSISPPNSDAIKFIFGSWILFGGISYGTFWLSLIESAFSPFRTGWNRFSYHLGVPRNFLNRLGLQRKVILSGYYSATDSRRK